MCIGLVNKIKLWCSLYTLKTKKEKKKYETERQVEFKHFIRNLFKINVGDCVPGKCILAKLLNAKLTLLKTDSNYDLKCRLDILHNRYPNMLIGQASFELSLK